MTTIRVLYTGDWHARLFPQYSKNEEADLGGASRLATVLKSLSDNDSIIIDSGDFLEGPLAESTQGEIVIDVMNAANFSVAGVGNHDFIFGVERLKQLEKKASFNLVSANIALDGKAVPWIKPYVVRNVNGVKLAFTGVTPVSTQYELPEKDRNRLEFQSPYKALKDTIRRLERETPDLIIAIPHLRLSSHALGLVREFPQVHSFIFGHAHLALHEGDRIDGKLVASPGCYGMYVGELSLSLDSNNRLVDAQTRLHPVYTDRISPDPEVESLLDPVFSENDKLYLERIGRSKYDLRQPRHDTSNFGELLADAIREKAGSPFSMVLSSAVRDSVFKGPISTGNLRDALRDEQVLIMRLSGEILFQALEDCHQNKFIDPLIPSGLRYAVDWRKPEGKRITNIEMEAQPIKDHEIYYTAVDSGALQMIRPLRGIDALGSLGSLRGIFKRHVENNSPLNRKTPDGRVHQVGSNRAWESKSPRC